MYDNFDPSTFPLRLEGGGTDKLLPIAARIQERISEIPTIEVHFFSLNEKLDLEGIVGKPMHLVAESEDLKQKRWFRGTCISAEYISELDVGAQFKAVVRPWLWFLTRRTDLRIFQEMTVPDIIQSILQDYGFSSNIKLKLTQSHVAREYCVQYRETDLDFLHRLMEEEGIYYYFDHSTDTETMVMADDRGQHEKIVEPAELAFKPYTMRSTHEINMPHVFDWSAARQVRSAKVVLDDYDFDKSTADLISNSEATGADYFDAKYERYDYPGHFRDSDLGDARARVRMEAEAAPHALVKGVSDAVTLAVGYTFTVKDLPRDSDPKEVMLVECAHDLVQIEAFKGSVFNESVDLKDMIDFDLDPTEPHVVKFGALDTAIQYRAPLKTPWPNVGGVHTAIVTGPKKEEIWTDKYGRIKVQFHWDRHGKKDENTTCFVRTMMPWTGKNWGAIAIPRIGQEVVISFEEGDPDRPMCIGMLYNDATMPPYALPENQTQSGVKTNSTKGGGGFNELMFEDKKSEELVRFQAEKNYEQIVKNDATITIGVDKKDQGDLTMTVENDVTETINSGNYKETVKKGNHVTNIDLGDHKTTLKAGNMDVSVKSGKITVSAAQSIEFKCGGSTIKMDPMSITIKSTMVTVHGEIKADIKSPMTTVKGDAMLTLKGGVVFIN